MADSEIVDDAGAPADDAGAPADDAPQASPKLEFDRAAFRKIADQMKAKAAGAESAPAASSTGTAAPPGDAAPAAEGAAAAGVGEIAPDGKPAEGAQVPPEAVPDLNPEVISALERVAAQEEDLKRRQAEYDVKLKERETAITAREQRAAKYGKGLAEDALGALTEQVVAILGEDAPEDDIAAEVADRVSEMSMKLGNLSEDPKDPKVEQRRFKREKRLHEAEKRRTVREAKEAAERETNVVDDKKTIVTLGERLLEPAGEGKPPLIEGFPWLKATPDAGAALFRFIESHHAATGKIPGMKPGNAGLDLAVAARACEDEIRKAFTAAAKRYAPLLQTPSKEAAKAATVPQGDPPNRRSSTPPKPAATEAPPDPNRPYDPDEHRKDTLKKLRSAFPPK